MRVRQALAVVLLALLPAMARGTVSRSERPIFVAYDVDSTSLTYCNISAPITGPGRVETSGSNAVVTAVAGTTDPFTGLIAGDELIFGTPTGPAARIIITATSATSTTVDAAIDLDVTNGVAFQYRTYGSTCGTGATSGWFSPDQGEHTVCVRISQVSLGSGNITYSIETKVGDAYESGPTQVLTGSYTSATFPANGDCFNLGEKTTQFRVGLQIGGAGADDGADTGVNREKVDVIIATER